MGAAAIIADALSILNIGQMIVTLGQDAAPYIALAGQVLGGTALTDAQRAQLLTDEAAATARLNAPSIPADQP